MTAYAEWAGWFKRNAKPKFADPETHARRLSAPCPNCGDLWGNKAAEQGCDNDGLCVYCCLCCDRGRCDPGEEAV